jgi:hypothetical protein
MFAKLIVALSVFAAVAVSGSLWHAAQPSATPVAATSSCCSPGSDCCYPGSPCCADDCCAAGGACCNPPGACCGTAQAPAHDCCAGGACCNPPQDCCLGGTD